MFFTWFLLLFPTETENNSLMLGLWLVIFKIFMLVNLSMSLTGHFIISNRLLLFVFCNSFYRALIFLQGFLFLMESPLTGF